MKFIKYLIPLWFGVMIYAGLSFAFGPRGFLAYNQLMAEKEKQDANIEDLVAINRDFLETRENLINADENYFIYARELGFAASGERFIRIIGLRTPPRTLPDPGHAVYALPAVHTPERLLRIFSFFAALTLLISMVVYDFLKFLRD